MPFFLLIPVAAKLAAAGAAKLGGFIAAKSGAATAAHAAAGAATSAGASTATAATIGHIAGGALIAAEAGGLSLAARAAFIAGGAAQLEAARATALTAERQRKATATTLATGYDKAVTEQQRIIGIIKAASKPVLAKFNDHAAAMDTDHLPSIQRLLEDVSHLPKVPKPLARTAPELPKISQAMVNITTVEMQAINFQFRHGHPGLGCTMFLAKVYGKAVAQGANHYFEAARQKDLAEGDLRTVEICCRLLLGAHDAARRAVAAHCETALELFQFHAKAGLELSGTNRPWSELTDTEQEAVAALKAAHDLLVSSLSALIEPVSG